MRQIVSAHDFMVVDLVTLSPQTNVFCGVAKLLNSNISGAPVVDSKGKLLGLFSEKCCMNVLSATAELAKPDEQSESRVEKFMATELTTLSPATDVFDAINFLQAKRVSGAPVVDAENNFLGIFSEKTAMRVLMAAAYDRLPGTRVEAYMNPDQGRLIDRRRSLMDIVKIFQETVYRRLPVVESNVLVGQVSRRDVLRAQHHLSRFVHEAANSDGDSANASQETVQQTPNGDVADFMDTEARTIAPNTDLFSIAQIFLDTPYRRLPVIQYGKLLGQISRRDVLFASNSMLHSMSFI